ncbi:hypothetical protein TNCV_3899621 [Trichonephila clavipes]|nr:hypothetical protein TNCV_3899621 [Trichonephila clavipes]
MSSTPAPLKIRRVKGDAQASSSSLDHGLKLRGPSPNLTCIAVLHGGPFLWHWARTPDMPTMIRYLDHLIPRPQDRRQKPSRS